MTNTPEAFPSQVIADYNAKCETLNLTRSLKTDKDLPARAEVEDDQTDWAMDVPDYIDRRRYKIASKILHHFELGLYHTDPESITEVERDLSVGGTVLLDERGRPLNPLGRTGIAGRGVLWQWGERATADPVVLRPTADGEFEALIISKSSKPKPALPGGFIEVEEGETEIEGAIREAGEETGVDVEGEDPYYLGTILTNSSRTTDHAWLSSASTLFIVKNSLIIPDAHTSDESDADEAAWMAVTPENLARMSKHHRVLVMAGVEVAQQQI